MTLVFSAFTLPPLFTLAQAKTHLRLTDSAYDADVQQKLDAAQDAIVRYLNLGVDPGWTAATTPAGIKNGVLLLLGYFWMDRGDGAIKSPWPLLYETLSLYRDPTVKC